MSEELKNKKQNNKKEKNMSDYEAKKGNLGMDENMHGSSKHSSKKKSETADISTKLKNENEKLKKEIDKLKEENLRTLAEYDNYRKRTSKELDSRGADARALVLQSFLTVVDNFERAANDKTGDIESYRKGVKMIFEQFSKILSDFGVESFGEKGDKFDPNIHLAVMHAEDEKQEENVIDDVFIKGYKIEDKILRPASVKVVN